MDARRDRPAPRFLALTVAVGALSALGAMGGCYKPLFPSDSPRNQFETYDRLRQRYVPLEEPDVFGNPKPALRARLTTPS